MSDKQALREKMFSMIEDWKQSGARQQVYCKEHSLAYHKFHYWYNRYKKTVIPDRGDGQAFIRIDMPAQALKGCAEIIYPDGKRLMFHQPVAVHFLKALLQ